MKRIIAAAAVCALMAGCASVGVKDGAEKVYSASAEEGVLRDYYLMKDGTWHTDGKEFSHRVELTGRLNGAETDGTCVVLTDDPDGVTYEDAMMSMLSSKYTLEESAFVLVEMR